MRSIRRKDRRRRSTLKPLDIHSLRPCRRPLRPRVHVHQVHIALRVQRRIEIRVFRDESDATARAEIEVVCAAEGFHRRLEVLRAFEGVCERRELEPCVVVVVTLAELAVPEGILLLLFVRIPMPDVQASVESSCAVGFLGFLGVEEFAFSVRLSRYHDGVLFSTIITGVQPCDFQIRSWSIDGPRNRIPRLLLLLLVIAPRRSILLQSLANIPNKHLRLATVLAAQPDERIFVQPVQAIYSFIKQQRAFIGFGVQDPELVALAVGLEAIRVDGEEHVGAIGVWDAG